MKRRFRYLLVLTSAIGVSSTTFASNGDRLCANKIADVEQQMSIAREHGNTHRLRGLEKALESIRNNCSDEKLLTDAEEEVRDSIEEVEERQKELDEAIQKGDKDKIEKRRVKLKEATEELEDDSRQLKTLRKNH